MPRRRLFVGSSIAYLWNPRDTSEKMIPLLTRPELGHVIRIRDCFFVQSGARELEADNASEYERNTDHPSRAHRLSKEHDA